MRKSHLDLGLFKWSTLFDIATGNMLYDNALKRREDKIKQKGHRR